MHAEDFIRVDNHYCIIAHTTILVFSCVHADPDLKMTNIYVYTIMQLNNNKLKPIYNHHMFDGWFTHEAVSIITNIRTGFAYTVA